MCRHSNHPDPGMLRGEGNLLAEENLVKCVHGYNSKSWFSGCFPIQLQYSPGNQSSDL